MLRLILFLLIGIMIVRLVVRATRFLSGHQRRRQMEEQRRKRPEDFAKKAQVIEEERAHPPEGGPTPDI